MKHYLCFHFISAHWRKSIGHNHTHQRNEIINFNFETKCFDQMSYVEYYVSQIQRKQNTTHAHPYCTVVAYSGAVVFVIFKMCLKIAHKRKYFMFTFLINHIIPYVWISCDIRKHTHTHISTNHMISIVLRGMKTLFWIYIRNRIKHAYKCESNRYMYGKI